MKGYASEMDDFALEFLNIAERNFTVTDAESHGAADANTGRRRGRRVTTSLSEINVIPLVDVMLVLLIIFMVAAPMLQRGVEVNLPMSRRADKMTKQISST